MDDPHIEADDFILLILKHLWQIECDNMIDQTIIQHNYYIQSLCLQGIICRIPLHKIMSHRIILQ